MDTGLPVQYADIYFAIFIRRSFMYHPCGSMKGLHQLIFMFSALDSCPRSPTENDLTISSQTSLLIPFKVICEEDSQEKFKFSKFLQAQKAYHFFERDFFLNGIQFKNRQDRSSTNILQKFKMLFLLEILLSSCFFASLLSTEPNGHGFDDEDDSIESSINFDPSIQLVRHGDINITAMKKRQLKTMFSFNTNSQTTNINYNNWKAL